MHHDLLKAAKIKKVKDCAKMNILAKTEQAPETNPHIYSYLIYKKRHHWISVERLIFSVNGAGSVGYPLGKSRP